MNKTSHIWKEASSDLLLWRFLIENKENSKKLFNVFIYSLGRPDDNRFITKEFFFDFFFGFIYFYFVQARKKKIRKTSFLAGISDIFPF